MIKIFLLTELGPVAIEISLECAFKRGALKHLKCMALRSIFAHATQTNGNTTTAHAKVSDYTADIYTIQQYNINNQRQSGFGIRSWWWSRSSEGRVELVAELMESWYPPYPAVGVWSPSSAVYRGLTSSADCPSTNHKFPQVYSPPFKRPFSSQPCLAGLHRFSSTTRFRRKKWE